MSLKSDLEILREARALLEKSYVRWTVDDDHGGHCALGCFNIASGLYVGTFPSTDAWRIIEDSAKRLHPELVGKWRPRNIQSTYDEFDEAPAVFVNNQLGKEAILEVFNDAILHLEMSEMLATIESEHAKIAEELLRGGCWKLEVETQP